MIGRRRDQTRARPGLPTIRQEDAETEALNAWKTWLAGSDPSGHQEPPRWLVPLLRRRPAWEVALRRSAALCARILPFAFVLWALDQLGARYELFPLGAGRAFLPRSLRAFPQHVGSLFGRVPDSAEGDRLIKGRAVFLLTRVFLLHALWSIPRTQRWEQLRHVVDSRGVSHLRAALGAGRGVVLVTAHFGFPSLIRPVLDSLAVRGLVVTLVPTEEDDVTLGPDVWERARATQRLRVGLADNAACVILPDYGIRNFVEVPFLKDRINVARGPFVLARLAGCPVLPVFSVGPPGTRGFQVEFGPALPLAGQSDDEAIASAVDGFVRVYEGYARRHPSQLFAFQRVFGDLMPLCW